MFRRLLPVATALALTLPLAACGSDSSGPDDVRSIENTTFAPALGVDLAAMTETSSGLYLRDLAVGEGALVAEGQTLAVHYEGWLPNGTQFDVNGPDETPFEFELGAGEVIAGWDEGVAGMRVGGRRQLVIPPSLGYGSVRNGPIPPNSILVFTVEVVGAE